MKNFRRKVILIISVLVFIPLSRVYAEQKVSESVESSVPVQAFIAVQNNIKDGEYEAVWKKVAKDFRMYFGGDIENFKGRFSLPEFKKEFTELKIKDVRLSTIQKAELISPTMRFLMIQADGEWKFAGKLRGKPEGREANSEEMKSPVQAFIAVQNNIKDGEYEAVWKTAASPLRREFGGDIDLFKERFSTPEFQREFTELKIKDVRLSTIQEAELISPTMRFLMIQEDGEWKLSGMEKL